MSAASDRRRLSNRRAAEAAPLNPQQRYTQEKHMAEREQRDFETAVNTRASQQDRADTLKRTTGLPGAVPRSATRGSRMSEYDLKEQARRNALLPGMGPKKPISAALTGPATPQNTGVTGVNAGTPDFGSTRRLPGQSLETFMPDAKGGRYVGSVANPPPRTDVPRRTISAPSPDVTPPVASTPAAGVRTVAIDPKFSPNGSTNNVGTSVEQWRHDLLAKHPEIFKAGTPENLAFVAAHKNPDGSMKPLDANSAMSIANDVKQNLGDAAYAKANEGRIKEEIQNVDDADYRAANESRIKAASAKLDEPRLTTRTAETPSATPRVTVNGANNPPVIPPEEQKPLLRRGLEGIASAYGAGTDFAKNTASSLATKGLDFLQNPATTVTRGLVDEASKIGRAVGPSLLSPEEYRGVSDVGSRIGQTAISAAKGLDFAKNAIGAGLPSFGVQPEESDEEKRRRLGLP